MIKKIIFFCMSFSILFAKVQDVELVASNVAKHDNIIKVDGNVVAYSQDYFITADKAIYDQNTSVAEFFGNVNLINKENEISKTNYLKVDFKNNNVDIAQNFMMDKQAEIWADNQSSCSDENYYRTKNSIVSSCNIKDPDWHIEFTSGKLNKNTKFLHLYNPVFYIKNTPVLYLPYFGFPMDKTRRTGLLIPEAGYNKKQGIYYKQPIYFAPYASWDFELDPQIRSKRGVGAYGIFRFADSPYSYGELRGGIFHNKDKYIKKYNYKNINNYGFELFYDRNKIVKYLFDGDLKENLFLDYKNVNDIAYFDLKEKKGENEDPLIKSKLNYFITNDNHYLGVYSKYYIDTDKLSSSYAFKNKDTVQELPSLQYHKFLDSVFFDKFLYSFDLKSYNYTRKFGSTATQYVFNMPIYYTMPVFSEYANFGIMHNLYATSINYYDNYNYKNSKFIQKKNENSINEYFKFFFNTDLAKTYKNFFHTVTFGLDFIVPAYKHGYVSDRLFKKYQYDYDLEQNNLNTSFLNDSFNNLYYEDNFINKFNGFTNKNLQAHFTQYFFNSNGEKKIRHEIKQNYDLKTKEFDSLDHIADFYIKNGFSVGNRFKYSYKNHEFSRVQSYINYNNNMFQTSISHVYEKERANKEDYVNNKNNFFIINANLKLPKNYSTFATIKYDAKDSYTKMWRLGLSHHRKCWNYTIVYQEDIEARTYRGVGYTKGSKERGVYLFVNFYPFGGLGYDYSSKNEYIN